MPETETGVDDDVDVPLPNCPCGLSPQHLIVPPDINAHAKSADASDAIFVTEEIPDTATGVVEIVVVPFPNWPTVFLPTH